jgi:uncharacterized membrane-anchored protein YitT (DUF2179 family)
MSTVSREIKNILSITFGSALLAFGVAGILLPAKIATGGTPGLSIIAYFLTNIDVSISMVLINIPLIIAGIKFITPGFALRTVYSVSMTSFFIGLYPYVFNYPSIIDMLLSTLYGGICIGAGIGFILKGQASAGGTTIIAKIISNYSSIKPGQVILVLDVIIICGVALIYNDITLALWSLLSIYITVKVIDKVLTGTTSEKVVHIVSQHSQEIGEKISKELGREGSMLSAKNLLLNKSKTVIFVVVGSREIEKIKTIIHQYDEEAIVIIMEASEIMGSSLIS